MKEWFESWFDTKYYHTLYKNRDHSEAEGFIRNLFQFLDLEHDKKVLDLACGKGRHAIFVNSLGYPTTGVDLSAESIATAREKETDSLRFFQHDMREKIKTEKYDLVLNLFTSFGYFNELSDNQSVISAIYGYLNKGGTLVIDFLNVHQVQKALVEQETKMIDGITFHISRAVKNGFIIKDIRFIDEGKDYHFQEKVQLLTLTDFKGFLKAANFEISSIFGNYELDAFNAESDRLIIIAKKNQG